MSAENKEESSHQPLIKIDKISQDGTRSPDVNMPSRYGANAGSNTGYMPRYGSNTNLPPPYNFNVPNQPPVYSGSTGYHGASNFGNSGPGSNGPRHIGSVGHHMASDGPRLTRPNGPHPTGYNGTRHTGYNGPRFGVPGYNPLRYGSSMNTPPQAVSDNNRNNLPSTSSSNDMDNFPKSPQADENKPRASYFNTKNKPTINIEKAPVRTDPVSQTIEQTKHPESRADTASDSTHVTPQIQDNKPPNTTMQPHRTVVGPNKKVIPPNTVSHPTGSDLKHPSNISPQRGVYYEQSEQLTFQKTRSPYGLNRTPPGRNPLPQITRPYSRDKTISPYTNAAMDFVHPHSPKKTNPNIHNVFSHTRNMPDAQGIFEPHTPPPSYKFANQADEDEDNDSVFDYSATANLQRTKRRTYSAPLPKNMGTGSKATLADGMKKVPSIYHITENGAFLNSVPDIRSTEQDVGGTVKRASSMQSISSRASRSTMLAQKKQRFVAMTSHATQRFSERKRKALANFSSVNYAPTHSVVYKDWLKRHPVRISWDRWVLMILIGLAIGLLAALMKQCLAALALAKWGKTKELARALDLNLCFAWTAGLSVIFVIVASILVTFIHPPAAGSGVPDVLSNLNGVVIHGTLSLKTLVVKFLSLILSVSSGIPCAIQGPIIAMGAIIGVGIGQFKSGTLGWTPKWFSRFRTPEERRNFMTAGVAAGVAAAFSAPIGGLFFALEDLASFWNNRIAWQTFFGCGIATVIANLFNSAFTGFTYLGSFGLFSFTTPDPIPVSVVSLVPAIVIGIVGGILGALFTRLNTLVVKIRKNIITSIPHPTAQKFARVLETVIICILMAAAAVWLPSAIECSPDSQYNVTVVGGCSFSDDFPTEPYTCCAGMTDRKNCTQYNEEATLFYSQGLEMWNMLTAKGVHRKFGYKSLGYLFPVWYLLTIWTAGSAIAGGIFVPLLVGGALYGRVIGLGVLDIYTTISGVNVPIDRFWQWIDPGFMAVIGAGTLLAGVTRKQLAITVIVVEMSQDIDVICPLLLANFVAKIIADFLCKPLYKIQLEAKALPYLDSEATVVVEGRIANLELYTARDIMTRPVKTIHVTETMGNLARLLMDTDHGGFPVVRYDKTTNQEHLYGLITRTELYVILCDESVYEVAKDNVIVTPNIDYEELSVDYLADPSRAEERVRNYTKFDFYNEVYINLAPFINVSAPKVDQNYSLSRTYQLFRTLGLRHLMVIDLQNRVQGVITRKDLMPFHIAECLANVDENDDYSEQGDAPALPAIKIHSDTPTGSSADLKNFNNNNGVTFYVGPTPLLSVETPL